MVQLSIIITRQRRRRDIQNDYQVFCCCCIFYYLKSSGTLVSTLFHIYLFFRVIFVESYISPLLLPFFFLGTVIGQKYLLVNDWSFLYVYFFRFFRFKSGLNPFTFYKKLQFDKISLCVFVSILDLTVHSSNICLLIIEKHCLVGGHFEKYFIKKNHL